jgi:hypothetical protein
MPRQTRLPLTALRRRAALHLYIKTGRGAKGVADYQKMCELARLWASFN